MDDMILKKARAELDEVKRLEEKKKERTNQQKLVRDQMLYEAKRKKQNDFKDQRKREIDEVEKLRADLQ